jgi:hypothetical protein
VPEIERAVEECKLSPTTAADEIAGILGL